MPTNTKRYNKQRILIKWLHTWGRILLHRRNKVHKFEFWVIALNLNVLRLYILITFAKWKCKNVCLVFACCLIGCVRKCPSLNHLYLLMFQSECIAISVQWRRGILFSFVRRGSMSCLRQGILFMKSAVGESVSSSLDAEELFSRICRYWLAALDLNYFTSVLLQYSIQSDLDLWTLLQEMIA